MNLVQALNYFEFKKPSDNGMVEFDEEEDLPERSVKKWAIIPESTYNERISIPCHPEYLRFITLNPEKDYFNDFKSSEINKLIKRLNIVIEQTVEQKNSIEFDNHYKSEDVALSIITLLGMLVMGLIYAASMIDISKWIFAFCGLL